MARMGSGNDGQKLAAADRSVRKDAELYVFVRVSISCSPTAGVDQLNGKQVRTLFQTRPKDSWQRHYQLVLLGWQPDSLASEPSIQNLAAIHRVAAIRVFGFDPHRVFSVWLPTQAELSRFRRAHQFVDCRILTAEFTASLKTSLYAPADALALLADRADHVVHRPRRAGVGHGTFDPRAACGGGPPRT